MSPSLADEETIRRHLLALDRAVERLRRHLGRPAEHFDQDPDLVWIVERGLLLCAQNALDIATHIAASHGRDVPDYATAIDRLRELGVLAPDFAARFRAIAGFRNVLVHGYLELDPRRLHRLLHERLDDFRTFAERIDGYLAASR